MMLEETLFHQALAKPPGERAGFLEHACGGDADLRRRLEALLQAHEHPGSFLGKAALDPARTVDPQPGERATEDQPGRSTAEQATVGGTIGRYKLLQSLGEGGMGQVWVAEQTEPVRRRVAVKVIKAGLDSASVLARFEQERQAIAMMDHPNIAKVLDAGTTGGVRGEGREAREEDPLLASRPSPLAPHSGRPYFVMELIKGIPITRYCDQEHLTPRQRLDLFIPVCQAVQHAHQKGIIHRDLKPSNVLVALYDGKPVPKVIDFGVAKATGQRLTEGTIYTEVGQIVGTLEYMAPEQAELNNLDIDTRADIYSLGVLLYELLTGSPPFSSKQLRSAAFTEMLRIIREQEPPKPSTKLSSSEELPSIAANRRLEPKRLTKLVHGDLDWIVMKCLEKERGRRYDTANGLAMDVQRYLAEEPVLAGPPGAAYRLRKFLRRNQGPVLAAALVLLTLVGGIIGTSWGLVRTENALQAEEEQRRLAEGKEQEAVAAAVRERQAKEREAEQRQLAEANEKKAVTEKLIAEAVRTFLQRDLLRQANPTEQAFAVRQLGGGFETKENPTIKELLDRAAAELTPAKIEAKFPGQKEVQASVLRTVGETYMGIGAYSKAAEFLVRANAISRDTLGPDHPDTIATVHNLAVAYQFDGQAEQAINLLEQVRDALVKQFGAGHRDTLLVLGNLAMAYSHTGKLTQAVSQYEQVRDAQIKLLGAEHPSVLTTLHNLAHAYKTAGRLPEAIALYEQLRETRMKKFAPDDPDTLIGLNNLATAYALAGKSSQAIALHEQLRDRFAKKFGAAHPNTLANLASLATAYKDAGKSPQAIELFKQLRPLFVKKLGADHPETLTVDNNLAGAYWAVGNLPQAISLFEEVRDARVKKLGAGHPDTLDTLNNLAVVYSSAGKMAQAVEILEQVRDARVKEFGADHPNTLITFNNLALAYSKTGKRSQAVALFEQVRDAQIKKLGAEHPAVLTTLHNLALAYLDGGKLPQAIELYEQVREVCLRKLGTDHPQTLITLSCLGTAYQEAGKLEQALALFRQATESVEKRNFQDLYARRIVAKLCECHEQLRQYAEAEVWRRKALAVFKERSGAESPGYVGELAQLGHNLLHQNKWPDAESVLRECLTLREKQLPDIWTTFNTKSMLGEALLNQKKYAEAEPLLLQGYDGMKRRQDKIPPTAGPRLREALGRLVQLYEATGQKEKAAEWRKKLEAEAQPKKPTP